jgi:hypothetical protein
MIEKKAAALNVKVTGRDAASGRGNLVTEWHDGEEGAFMKISLTRLIPNFIIFTTW